MVDLVCFLLPATEPQGWVVRHGDAAALYKFLLDDLKEEPTNGGLLQIRFKFKCLSYFLFFFQIIWGAQCCGKILMISFGSNL